jgi:hypothetical protein
MQNRNGGIGKGLTIGTHHPTRNDRRSVLSQCRCDHSRHCHTDGGPGKNVPMVVIHVSVYEEEFSTTSGIYGRNVTVLLWKTLIDQLVVH